MRRVELAKMEVEKRSWKSWRWTKRAPQLRLRVRDDGYCLADDILALEDFMAFNCALEGFYDIRDSKRRFEIITEGSQVLIRATRGHSLSNVEDDSLYIRLRHEVPPSRKYAICIHCTYRRAAMGNCSRPRGAFQQRRFKRIGG